MYKEPPCTLRKGDMVSNSKYLGYKGGPGRIMALHFTYSCGRGLGDMEPDKGSPNPKPSKSSPGPFSD